MNNRKREKKALFPAIFKWGLALCCLLQIGIASHFIWGENEWEVTPLITEFLEHEASKEGFLLEIHNASFRLNGKANCEQLILTSKLDPSCQIICDDLRLIISPWSILLGNISLRHVSFNKLHLKLPVAEAEILGDISLLHGDFSFKKQLWNAKRGLLQTGDISFIYEGLWHPWNSASRSNVPAVEKLHTSIQSLTNLRQQITLRSHLYAEGLIKADKSKTASLQIYARDIECAPELKIGQCEGSADLSFSNPLTPKLQANLHTHNFTYANEFHIQRGDFTLTSSFALVDNVAEQLSGYYNLFGFDGFGFQWGSLSGNFKWLKNRTFLIDTNIAQDDEWINCEGFLDLGERSCELTFSGFFSPENLYRIPAFKKIEEIKDIQFIRAPFWQVTLATSPNFQFKKCNLLLDAGAINLMGVPVNELQLKATIKEGALWAHDISLKSPVAAVTGSYWHDVDTQDYRFLLEGSLLPHTIDHWMLPWWSNLWKHFEIKGTHPQANIDIQGQWGHPQKRFVLGDIKLENACYKDAPIELCQLSLFSSPFYLHLSHFFIDEPSGGQATLDVQWIYHPIYQDPFITLLSGEGALSLNALSQSLGKDIAEILAPFDCPSAPSLKVKGWIYGEDSPLTGMDFLEIATSVPAPFTYYNVPLDWMSFRAERRYQRVTIDGLELGCADGYAHGFIQINNKEEPARLKFDIHLSDSPYDNFLKFLPSLRNMSADALDDKSINKIDALKEPVQGIMNVNIRGEGDLGHFDTFNIAGDLNLREAALGQLSLFGPLSNILQRSFLKFSKLELTEMASSFNLAKGRLELPDAVINGPTANMRGKGYYLLDTDQLHFMFSVHILGNTKIPVVSQVINFIDPVSKVMRVKLTGGFDEPQWGIVFNPFGMLEGLIPEQKADSRTKKAAQPSS